jgi:hypothetical protein
MKPVELLVSKEALTATPESVKNDKQLWLELI